MIKLVFNVLLFSMIIAALDFNQEAEAASMTFTVDTTISSDATILVGETWIINPGVTVTFATGKNLFNHGTLINNGNLILIGDGTSQSGNITNLDSSTFTNSGSVTITGSSGYASGSLGINDSSSFINSGMVIITGNNGHLSGFLSLANSGQASNTGSITITGSSGKESGSLRVVEGSTFSNTNTIIITGSSGEVSGHIALADSGKFTNSGSITLTGGSGTTSGLLDNWDDGIFSNSGTITITGKDGVNSGIITNMGTSSFKNSGIISLNEGTGSRSGRIVNSGNASFENIKTITIISSGPVENTGLLNKDSSTFLNKGTITIENKLVNFARTNNFGTIMIGNDLNNQGETINNCGIIIINGILIGNSILESTCAGSGRSHENPTIGKTSWGFQVVQNGICIDIKCWTVTSEFHQDFELVEMLSDSTHTISATVFCHNGVTKCNYVAFGVSPYGTNISDSVWKVILQKDHRDNWSMTVIDPDGYLGDVTSTTQIINDEKNLAVSMTALFKKPTPGMILNIETRDSYGGYNTLQFNDGIAIKDVYAYPATETHYEDPIETEPLCLNENPNKRYTCAFDKVREWTIKNAEAKLQQIIKE